MKEVQGELNTTLIVVISVGVLMTFFFSYLWPLIRYNFESQTNCKKATCNCNNDPKVGKVGRVNNGGTEYCTCTIDGEKTFTCVYRG